MAAATEPLARWYREHGRHDLPWRDTRDRWAVLVSEVMLQQTQVSRVLDAWPRFIDRFPDPAAMARSDAGDVIREWGNLGYPRRARRLWESARSLTAHGWPTDLTELPGVGRYTAAAVATQADGADLPAVDANIRRVSERFAGRRLSDTEAETVAVDAGGSLSGRDRLLALMDVGSLLCRPRSPRCDGCPLAGGCRTQGVLADETRHRQAAFEGSFRQRRGRVLGRLREEGRAPAREFDGEALESLVADGLAVVDHSGDARLP